MCAYVRAGVCACVCECASLSDPDLRTQCGLPLAAQLRHPNILAFKESVETQEKGSTVIYLVTQPVRPLKTVLEELDLQGQHRCRRAWSYGTFDLLGTFDLWRPMASFTCGAIGPKGAAQVRAAPARHASPGHGCALGHAQPCSTTGQGIGVHTGL